MGIEGISKAMLHSRDETMKREERLEIKLQLKKSDSDNYKEEHLVMKKIRSLYLTIRSLRRSGMRRKITEVLSSIML